MKSEKKPSARKDGAAHSFIEQRQSSGYVSFSLDMLMSETGLSRIAARNQLLRLENRVVRPSPRLPFFLIVPPEYRSLGAPPMEWWLDDYLKWLKCPYYVGLLTAASIYGASPQAIQETQVIVGTSLRTLSVGRIRVRFFKKKGINRSMTQPVDGSYAPLTIGTIETTCMDLIRYMQRLGGVERMTETIAPLLNQLNENRLRLALDAENEAPVAQRLGFVLESLKANHLAETVRAWLQHPLRYVPLCPHSQVSEKHVNEKWRVLTT
jgi:hypothetical protein